MKDYTSYIWPLFIAIVLSGFNKTTAQNSQQRFGQAQRLTKSVQYEGVERSWQIYLPPNFSNDKAAPLVIALHGGGGNGSKFDETTTEGTLTAAADKRGAVLVFPEGIDKRWNDGRQEVFRGKRKYNDVGFISKLIDEMIQGYGIDSTRIYATGISNGGFMSVRLAMELSEKITAVAPVTAQVSITMSNKIPQHPISIMIVNGTEDPLVPFGGGHVRLFRFGRSRGEVLSTRQSIEIFRNFNGCRQPAEIIKMADLDPDDGTTIEIEKYAGGRNNSEVILVKVVGGGHTWPGGKQYLRPRMVGVVSRDINASEMILDFFLRHAKSDSAFERQ